MNIVIQEPVQTYEPESELINNRPVLENNSSAISALCAPVQSIENKSEGESRAPLREISDNTIELEEASEQEQDTKQDSSDDGLGNINDYVARILEKLEKQKQKASKLAGVASENKEKSQHVQDLASAFEEIANNENDEVDVASKENLSPVKSRLLISVKNDVGSSLQVKETPKHKLEDILHISKFNISYGHKLPGQVSEEHLDIVNKSDQDFIVKIEVDCLNEELQDTEEYVYSVRRSHLQEYNDRHYLIMAPYSCASFKFAMKVPNMKINGKIEGQVRICIDDVVGCYNIGLSTTASIPKVFCPKELRVPRLGYSVINLAVKEGKKQDFKLPIKNTGNVPVNMQFEFYEPNNENDSEDKAMFDCIVHPPVMTVPANGSAQLNVMVKPWKVSSKSKPIEKNKPFRKVLIGKVRDSALVYSFVFGIEFY